MICFTFGLRLWLNADSARCFVQLMSVDEINARYCGLMVWPKTGPRGGGGVKEGA